MLTEMWHRLLLYNQLAYSSRFILHIVQILYDLKQKMTLNS